MNPGSQYWCMLIRCFFMGVVCRVCFTKDWTVQNLILILIVLNSVAGNKELISMRKVTKEVCFAKLHLDSRRASILPLGGTTDKNNVTCRWRDDDFWLAFNRPTYFKCIVYQLKVTRYCSVEINSYVSISAARGRSRLEMTPTFDFLTRPPFCKVVRWNFLSFTIQKFFDFFYLAGFSI